MDSHIWAFVLGIAERKKSPAMFALNRNGYGNMVVIIVPITMIITAVIADTTATHEPNSGQSPFWTLPGFPGNVLLGDAISHRSGTIICTNGLYIYMVRQCKCAQSS